MLSVLKWKYQSQFNALVCKIFMPKQFESIRIDLSSYYRIPTIIRRLEICCRANNPLAKYYLHFFMKLHLDDLIDDIDNMTDDLISLQKFSDSCLEFSNTAKYEEAGDFFEAGVLMWYLNKKEEAVEAFKRANTPKAWNMLADLFNKKEYYEKALGLDKENVYSQAKLLILEGKTEETIKKIDKCNTSLDFDPNFLLYYLNSNFDDKINNLKNAASNSKDPTLLEIAAIEHVQKRKYVGAFNLYREAGEKSHPYAYFEAGQLAKKKKQDSSDANKWNKKAQELGALICIDGSDNAIKMFREEVLNRLLNIKIFVEDEM